MAATRREGEASCHLYPEELLTFSRFFENLPHMGYPDSLPVAYEWLEGLFPKKDELNLKN